LVFADEAWLYRIKARVGVFRVRLDETLELFVMFIQECIKQDDSLKPLVDTFHDQMG
jgi:hypothetical protein